MVSPAAFAEARSRSTDLARLTGLGVGGRPEFFFEPGTAEEAAATVARCAREGIPLRVLGGGFNLLVADGEVEGAVLSTRRLAWTRVADDRVEAGAGYAFPRLVQDSIGLGIPALPGCPGIPGTVGGAVAMNAGGRFGCVADALLEVGGVDARGRPFRRRVAPGDMGYRTSVFEGTVVLSASFRRESGLDPVAQRSRFDEALRWKQATQPLSARSAGCIFRNPAGTSAGRLVEAMGLKGRSVGDAQVSTVHANFIVNRGAATSADVRTLIEEVRTVVRERTGVWLDLEVRVW